MTLIFKNITKLFRFDYNNFGSDYNNLDAKFWVQKIILKKYLKKNSKLLINRI